MRFDSALKALFVYVTLTFAALLVGAGRSLSRQVLSDSISVKLDTMVVSREIPGKQLAGRSFRGEDVRTMPGSIGDPIRTLDVSAEVVTNSDLQAIPIIGGDEASSILTLIDGFPITSPYRFLGSLSLFNPLATSRVELLAAGYPISYGGYAPTAIRVSSRSDYCDRPSIEADASALVSSIFVQLPLSDSLKWSAKIAARTSNIGMAANLVSAPTRERLQAFMPSLKDVQVFFGEIPSADIYSFQECLLSQERGSLMGIDRSFDYSWQKEFAGAALLTTSGSISWEHRLSWTHDNIALSTFVPVEYVGKGRFSINSQFTTVRLQDELHYPILPQLNITAGSNVLHSVSDVGLQTFSTWLSSRSPLRSAFTDVSGFSEVQWALSEAASATIGVRETYFGFVRQFGFEPRGTFIYDLGDRSSIRLSLGRYLRSPSDFEILHGFLMFLAVPAQTPLMMLMSGYRNTLQLETNDLAALDITREVLQTPSLALDVRVAIYYKQTQSLIMPARYPSVFTPLDTMSFTPLQCFQGRKWGVGISSSLNFIPLSLVVNASVFSHHSRIIDGRTNQEYYTIGDIPVVVKFLVQFAPAGWQVNLLYQYATGSPTTDGYYLKGGNLLGDVVFFPVWKRLNTDRVPDYHRVDLSVARGWRSGNWTIDLVCSALNLFGNRNVSSYKFTFSPDDEDFVSRTPVVNSFPFMPNIEIRCQYTF